MKAEPSELELLHGLARNDRKVIEQIYRDNYNMVQSLVVNNSGSLDDARDVFQETMIILFEKARSEQFELNCLLKTYIYSVSRRIWLKKLQHKTRFSADIATTEQVVAIEDEIDELEKRDEEYEIMGKAILSLGEPCKSLLEAFYIQKKNMQQIATEFGYTNSENAKTQKYKCLMRLKKIFFSTYKNGG